MALGNLWIYLNGPKFIFGLNAGIIIQMIAKMEIMPLINAIDALMLANKEVLNLFVDNFTYFESN